MNRRESSIERYVGNAVKSLGGLWLKFTSPGNAGVPDRIVILPNGSIFFVELKAEDGELTPQQIRQIERFERRGATVYVIKGKTQAQRFVQDLRDRGVNHEL